MPGKSAAPTPPDLEALYRRLIAKGVIKRSGGARFHFDPNMRLDTSQVQRPWLPPGLPQQVRLGVLLAAVARMQQIKPPGATVFEDGSIRYPRRRATRRSGS